MSSTPAAANNPERDKNRNKHPRNRRKGKKGAGSTNSSNQAFKGKVSEICGNVFQLPSERKRRDQFKESVEALRIYASTQFQKNITYLEPLFRDLKTPTIPLPIKPESKEQTDDAGNITIVPPSAVEEDLYKEEIKRYGVKSDRLQASVRSIYNLVWGQCSELLRNKLREDPDFRKIDSDGDVAALLTNIRTAMHIKEEKILVYDGLDELQRQFYLYKAIPRRYKCRSPHQVQGAHGSTGPLQVCHFQRRYFG